MVIITQGYPVYLMTLNQGRKRPLSPAQPQIKTERPESPFYQYGLDRGRVCVVPKAQKSAGICLFVPQRTVV